MYIEQTLIYIKVWVHRTIETVVAISCFVRLFRVCYG